MFAPSPHPNNERRNNENPRAVNTARAIKNTEVRIWEEDIERHSSIYVRSHVSIPMAKAEETSR